MITFPAAANAVRLAASLLVLTALPAWAASVDTLETFVRHVYAQYRKSTDPGVSMDRPGGAAFYTAALLDAFAKDSALAHGEIGAIDYDPICSCQDYGPLRVKTVTVVGGTAETVTAQV